MSELRRQLERARAEHRSAVYPGDLAGDVLSAGRGAGARGRLMWIGGMAGAALAAGIAVVVLLNRPEPPGPVPQAEEGGVELVMGVLELPEKPDMPDERPEMPPYQAISGLEARPGMPSFFEVSSSAGDAEEQL